MWQDESTKLHNYELQKINAIFFSFITNIVIIMLRMDDEDCRNVLGVLQEETIATVHMTPILVTNI